MTVAAIIQARMDSTRFPGKVLKPLPFNTDETIISHITNRLKLSKKIDNIILATSDQKNDNPLEEESKRLNIDCFRGSKNNVLDRFIRTAKSNKIDIVVRLTGDNPIVFPSILDEVLKLHIDGGFDYSRNKNLPYGTSFEIVNANALDTIASVSTESEDQEHVTIFIKKNPSMFKVQEFDHSVQPEDLRLTVDYPQDYALMNIVIQHLYKMSENYSLEDVLALFKMNPWLKMINQVNQ